MKGSFADFHNLKYLAQPRDFNIPMNFFSISNIRINQGVTKTCRLSWLTNSALVYEPKRGGGGGGDCGCGVSANVYSSIHRSLKKTLEI